jgi:hypothetical protein
MSIDPSFFSIFFKKIKQTKKNEQSKIGIIKEQKPTNQEWLTKEGVGLLNSRDHRMHRISGKLIMKIQTLITSNNMSIKFLSMTHEYTSTDNIIIFIPSF